MESDMHVASAWERVAELQPDAPATIAGDDVRTWADFEVRSARLSAAFEAAGAGADSKVAHYLYNGHEYLETTFAAFKMRGVPCNVNFRYTPHELAYVLDNADAEVVVFDHTLADRLEEARHEVDSLRLMVQVGGEHVPDWAVDYEAVVAGHDPALPHVRSVDDLWFLYTGGTTGMPKAVMWSQATIFGSMEAALRPFGHGYPESIADITGIVSTAAERGHQVKQLAAAPLMHGTSMIVGFGTLTHGGAIACLADRSFSGDELWQRVAQHGLTQLTIVGDAFSRPMLDALDEGDHDTSSLRAIVSSGVMWSAEVKERILDRLPDVVLLDALGSSEGPGMANQLSSRKKARSGTTARFSLGEHTSVFTDAGDEVEPGSGAVGRIALGFPIPVGYYKDPDKTEETFPLIDGRRWSIPGDYATVEADGTITLLGRGSVCINTGGEKVFPEEVEEALKTHPAVVDANVVGLADERWGQSVNAVVSTSDTVAPDDLRDHLRAELAGYKIPKKLVLVEEVQRQPNGKADYPWARSILAET
ncbi:MAG: AMP-binding protein [Acidimicrobiales bacterium]